MVQESSANISYANFISAFDMDKWCGIWNGTPPHKIFHIPTDSLEMRFAYFGSTCVMAQVFYHRIPLAERRQT